MFLNRDRIVSAPFHGSVVANDHAFFSGDSPDAGDNPGARCGIFVHTVGRKLGELEERRSGIE